MRLLPGSSPVSCLAAWRLAAWRASLLLTLAACVPLPWAFHPVSSPPGSRPRSLSRRRPLLVHDGTLRDKSAGPQLQPVRFSRRLASRDRLADPRLVHPLGLASPPNTEAQGNVTSSYSGRGIQANQAQAYVVTVLGVVTLRKFGRNMPREFGLCYQRKAANVVTSVPVARGAMEGLSLCDVALAQRCLLTSGL